MQTLTEQRQQTRTSLRWPISVWLPDANRFFNGECENISTSGVYAMLPVTMPIRKGNLVEFNFPRTQDLAEEKGGFSRIKIGTVVRVERGETLKKGNIGVAVKFN